VSRKSVKIGICSLLIGCPFSQAWAAEERPAITVSGEAAVLVVPNKILVHLGVETWDKNLATAKSRNDAAINRAISAIRQSGVVASAIETDSVEITPDWMNMDKRNGRECKDEREYCEMVVRGYEVSNRFVVTLTETKKIEEIVSKALAAGVNHLYDVDFQTTDIKNYREQARELAVRAAKEKAQKMARALGQSVGEAIQVNEGSFYSWYSSPWSSGSSRMRGTSQNVTQNASGRGEESGSDVVALGKIAIRATVNVVFVLKPN